jgi:hypothetical protein
LRDENLPRFPILPIGNSHLIEVKYRCRGTAFKVFMKTPDYFLKETTRNFAALGFLREIFDPA